MRSFGALAALFLIVRLSSERARREVRQDRSFATKQGLPAVTTIGRTSPDPITEFPQVGGGPTAVGPAIRSQRASDKMRLVW